MKLSQPAPSYRLLLVDDEAPARHLLALGLTPHGFHVTEASSGADGLRLFGDGTAFDVVLTDLKMPGMSGIEFIAHVREADEHAQILVLTAFGAIETAVAAMRAGAVDYLTKPIEDIEHLARKLKSAAQLRHALRDNVRLRDTVTKTITGSLLLGNSPPIQQVRADIQALAPSLLPVLVSGPSGTGKELVARSLHLLSERAHGPIISVNAAALPDTLFEAELFGVEKGAYTGADRARPGLIRSADGGTLFLDEIGELSQHAQAKLLRVLEEKRVTAVGGSKEIPVDFRLIAATNRPLRDEISAGRFREDLYYRLSAATISLPSLRERGDDILLLTDHFLDESNRQFRRGMTISPAVRELLLQYAWPGNVRELRHAVERAVLKSTANELSRQDFDFLVTDETTQRQESAQLKTLAEVEAEHIRTALAACQWNMTETSAYLGIHRNTLRQKIKDYHLDD